MSKIGIEEVKRLAVLARIKLSDEQTAQLAAELGEIVGLVEKLQEAKVDGVTPTDQVTGLVGVWREDKVGPLAYERKIWLANLPDALGDYIKVKRVQE